LTNAEILQKAHELAGEDMESSAMCIQNAITVLEEANSEIKDVHTSRRIRDIKLRYADIEYLAKYILSLKGTENPEDKKTSQCYNCEGLGIIQADTSEIPCPVCDGSGKLST